MESTNITLDFITEPVMHNRRWTPDEHAQFKRYALRGLPVEHIAELMRRSYNSIVTRFQIIGHARYDPSTYSLYWTFRSGRIGKIERLPKEDTSLILTLSDANSIYNICKGLENVKL